MIILQFSLYLLKIIINTKTKFNLQIVLTKLAFQVSTKVGNPVIKISLFSSFFKNTLILKTGLNCRDYVMT